MRPELTKGLLISALCFGVPAVLIALVKVLKRCMPPIEVTYEVTSEDAKVADVNYRVITDLHFYWLEPKYKPVHLKRVKLPFRRTVKIPWEHPSDGFGASVGAHESLRCAVYFDGELVKREEASYVCSVNVYRDRWEWEN
jgi:hypothetical protein